MHGRGPLQPTANPGPFACRGCRTYVTGTESGHCPRCGLAPPSLRLAPAARRTASPRRPLLVIVLLAIWLALALYRLAL